MGAQPGARRSADDDARDRDRNHELEIMVGDGDGSITKCLQKPDLFTFKCDDPAEREVDQECRDQKEDRRQRAAHIPKHVEPVIQVGVRELILPAISGGSAIPVEQLIEPLEHLALRGIVRQLETERGEGAFKVVDTGKRPFRYPDDTEATIIWHSVAGPDRVDKLWRERNANDYQRALSSI